MAKQAYWSITYRCLTLRELLFLGCSILIVYTVVNINYKNINYSQEPLWLLLQLQHRSQCEVLHGNVAGDYCVVITKCYFTDCLLMTVFTKNPRFFLHVSVFTRKTAGGHFETRKSSPLTSRLIFEIQSNRRLRPPIVSSCNRSPLLSDQFSKIPKVSESNHYIWSLFKGAPFLSDQFSKILKVSESNHYIW